MVEGRWFDPGSGSGCIQPLQLFHWRNCMSVKSWGAMDWRHCIPWEQNFLKNALFVSVKVRESSWVRNFIWILAQSLMEICQSKLPSMTIQHPYRHKQSPVYLFLAFPIFFFFFFLYAACHSSTLSSVTHRQAAGVLLQSLQCSS